MHARDPEKMVVATAKALSLVDGGGYTPRILKLYEDDARIVLVEILKAAKRQKWEVADLLLALDPPKPEPKAIERDKGPPLRDGP